MGLKFIDILKWKTRSRVMKLILFTFIFMFYIFDKCFATSTNFTNFANTTNSNKAESPSLWHDLYETCGKKVSFYCVQDKLINYINNTFDNDLYITDGIYFAKRYNYKNSVSNSNFTTCLNNIHCANNNNNKSYLRTQRSVENLSSISLNSIDEAEKYHEDDATEAAANQHLNDTMKSKNVDEKEFSNFIKSVEELDDEDDDIDNNEIKDDKDDGKNVNNNETDSIMAQSLNTVTDILYDKATQYLSTHDLKLNLPELFFGGARIKVSPQGVDKDGAVLLKLNFNPETGRKDGGFVAKYLHKMFKKKLLTSFLAVLLIIKLVKIKLMYVLPLFVGVKTAKKLLLKTLLFLFPPLTHLFKLCTYYHAHASKLHFHHHKIKHHHHHVKVPVPVPVPVPVHKPSHYESPHIHDENDFIGSVAGDPYDGHSPPVASAAEPYGNLALTPDYYTRNDISNVQQHADELDSWGLKNFYASTESPGVLSAQAQAYSPYAEQNFKLNDFSSSKLSPGWKSKFSEGIKSNVLVTYDQFYSPILQKIDTLFSQLGFHDEACRERLVCSMYKNPSRFSPHSNLLSAELSRDPMELEKPIHTNTAVIRFYRYVEAAREGQSQKDCLKQYPSCSVKTE